MLIQGEKYACESCVRGHRVSNCQHSDRPLQHINKKGRPVSQCTHCRTLRKSRSAYVRCDCGEKAHSKGACPQDGESQDICCCSHGARCACALKKEHHLDPVPESDSDEASSSPGAVKENSRPRALTARSDSNLTTFSNGHHKPGHKHNNMAHKCGLPYVVPRAHSIHGPSPAGLVNRSVDNLPHTNTIDALHSNSQIKDSMVSAQQEQRLVKSEHGSPVLGGTSNLNQLNGILPPLDLSNLPVEYNFVPNMGGAASSTAEQEQPLFSAGLSAASIDWSHYDGLDFNSENSVPSYSQPPSWLDFNSIDQPGLTSTSTSGELSEVEDFGVVGEIPAMQNFGTQYQSDFDNTDFNGEIQPPYVGMDQLTGNLDNLDMEQFLKDAVNAPVLSNGLPGTDYGNGDKVGTDAASLAILGSGEDNDSFWMNDFMLNDVGATGNGGIQENHDVWPQ